MPYCFYFSYINTC